MLLRFIENLHSIKITNKTKWNKNYINTQKDKINVKIALGIFNICYFEIVIKKHFLRLVNAASKLEIPGDVSNSKVQKQDKFRRDWSQHKTTCNSQSGTGQGVCSSCHVTLFANVLWKGKSRKYRGVFEVKSRVKTWQVRGTWSQPLEHKQVPHPLQTLHGNHS